MSSYTPKVLFVGVFTPNSTNVSQAKGLEKAGAVVTRYDYRAKLHEFGNMADRDRDLYELILRERPVLTIYSKCNLMSFKPLLASNRTGRSCVWYMDPVNSNFDQELIEKVKRATFVCCGLWAPLNIAQRFNKNSFFVEQCYDPDVHFPYPPTIKKHDVMFIGDIRPMGNVHEERIEYLNALGFEYTDKAYGKEHSKVVSQTKINLNFTESDRGGTSVRLHKILASSGFVLTQPWNNMEESFVPGEHFDTFESIGELEEKIDYYLNREQERNLIAKQGYFQVQNYSPLHWAKKILELAQNV